MFLPKISKIDRRLTKISQKWKVWHFPRHSVFHGCLACK